MGIFGKLFGARKAPPAWAASFGSAARVDEFLAVVARDLRGRGERATIEDGVVRLEGQAAPEGLDLVNLAQTCRREPVAKWAELVALHFDQCLGARGQAAALLGDVADFDRVSERLRLRLHPAQAGFPEGFRPLARVVADDLLAVLVFDLPEAIQFVHEELAARWGAEPEALFERALAQTASDGALQSEAVSIDGTAILSLTGSPYAATHALFVEEYFEDVGPYGTLVACPSRGHVLAHAIRDASAMQAVRWLTAAAHGLYADAPYPITPSVYWRRDGFVERLASEAKDGGVTFAPTQEFADMMKALVPN
jgi:hypothetical protein